MREPCILYALYTVVKYCQRFPVVTSHRKYNFFKTTFQNGGQNAKFFLKQIQITRKQKTMRKNFKITYHTILRVLFN